MQQNQQAAQKVSTKRATKAAKKAAAKPQVKPVKVTKVKQEPTFVHGFEVGSKVWQHFLLNDKPLARLVKIVGADATDPAAVMIKGRAPGEKSKQHVFAVSAKTLARTAPFKRGEALRNALCGVVKFVRDIDGKTVEVAVDDAKIVVSVDHLSSIEKGFADSLRSASKELKKRFGLIAGDNVRLLASTFDGVKATIISVEFVSEDSTRLVAHVLRRDLDAASQDAALTIYETPDQKFPFEAWKAAAKFTFKDVPLFGAFVIGSTTFVKAGNSTGIRAHVSGTAAEPFAMLATETAQLPKNAKRSFKQSDKVKNFVAQQ